MKVRDILKLLFDDGWFLVVPQEVTDSSNTGTLSASVFVRRETYFQNLICVGLTNMRSV